MAAQIDYSDTARKRAIGDEILTRLRNLEDSMARIFDLTLNVRGGQAETAVRAVHQIARASLVCAPPRRLECEPNCQRWHTPAQAAEILQVSKRTIYEFEKRGLRVSRDRGFPRYLHAWLDEFMISAVPEGWEQSK